VAKRSVARKEINAAIGEITRTRPATHWVELFEEAGVPCGPIYNIDQMFADPQVKHLGMAAPVKSEKRGELSLVASPINMEGLPRKVYNATADAGQHTEEILGSVGYSKSEIEKMRANGVV